jgi:hypothetical protein
MSQMYASSTAGGTALGAPDVCNTPSASGVTPITYTNTVQISSATSTSSVVLIENMDTVTTDSSMESSNGDEAGVSGGVVSGRFMGAVDFKAGSSVVAAEDNDVVYQTSVTGHNGSSSNAVGAQLSQSQTKVKVAM